MYSSTISLTSALDERGWSTPSPGSFSPPGKTRYTFIVAWVGHRAGPDDCGKSRPPTGFDPRTVQPVASRYTDCAYFGHGRGCCEDGNELSVSTECDDFLVRVGE
jgi:hypothetical protein